MGAGEARTVVIAAVTFGVFFGVGFALREVPQWGAPSGWPLTPLPAYGGDISRAGGVVQRRTRDGWEDMVAGSAVYERDVVRVGNASYAWVTLAGGSTLQLGSKSTTLVEGGAAVQLTEGQLQIADGGQAVKVAVADGGIIRVAQGPVSVRSFADGTVEVQNKSTAVVEVLFDSVRGTVPPGKIARGGKRGLGPSRAPPEVAEPVRFRPMPKMARGDELVVAGQLDPALRVASASIGGVEAEIAPDGSFRVAVPLKSGVNRIALVTRDVFGNEQVYDVGPVRRLSDAEVAALRFEWSRAEEATATWGE